MLIAEAFVLLALKADGTPARGSSSSFAAGIGVTGALIAELVQQGHVQLPEGRIHVTATRPSHALLVQALENLVPHEGKKLKGHLGKVKNAGWSEVVDSMVAAGVLGRERHGIRSTRHPVADPAAHASLVAGVREIALGHGQMEPRTAALLAIAGPCHLLEVIAPDRSDRPAAKRRIAEAAHLVPVTEAVKHAVDKAAAAGSL
jgi:hypothetical protein